MRTSFAVAGRVVFNAMAALSLLVLTLAFALWARSYWRYDELGWYQRWRVGQVGQNFSAEMVSEYGRLDFHYQWYKERVTYPRDWPADGVTKRARAWRAMPAVPGRYAHLGRSGFYAGAIVRPDLVSRALHLPHWVIVGVACLLPIAWWRRRWRAKRPPGLCPKCGYDLRATPERCPECGFAAPPAAPALG